MELRQLRHFLAVLEHGSILRAADHVHLTQPALSRSIQTLESELGVRLFERSRRGIAPTPHGHRLADHARRLLVQAERARGEIQGLRTPATMHLAVGVGTHLGGGEALAHAIARLVDGSPHVAVTLLDASGEELVAGLQQGKLDVALCAWPADGVPNDLVFEEVATSDLAVICRAAHPLARRRHVPLAELATRRWAVAERPRALGAVLRLAFGAAGLAQPEPVVRTTSLGFLRGLLLASDLIALVPAGFVAAELANRTLVRLKTDVPPATTRIGVLRRNDAAPAVLVESFLDALRSTRATPRRRSAEARRSARDAAQ